MKRTITLRKSALQKLALQKLTLLTLLSLAFAGIFTAEAAYAAEPTVKPASGTLSFIRLYTGPDGVSHFVDEKLPLNAVGTEGLAAALAIHRIGDVKGAQFAMLKAGTVEDWHIAPRRQFMVCLRGLVEVTAADGEKRRLKPGEFALLEDTSGKGHITHAAGTEDHVALAVPIADGAFTKK
jgi:quercetin dioxygenase-like cupin family protein